MQAGTFSLSVSAFRTGTPVPGQQTCKLSTAGEATCTLSWRQGQGGGEQAVFWESLYMNAELCASHRGSGTILVPGGSGHQEGEDSKEAFQHSEKGEHLQPYPTGIYVTG